MSRQAIRITPARRALRSAWEATTAAARWLLQFLVGGAVALLGWALFVLALGWSA